MGEDLSVTATAAHYTWFSELFRGLADAFCVTLVRGLTPAELLDRLGARQQVRLIGVDEVVYRAYELPDPTDGFVGATTAGSWALAVEPNGYLGVSTATAVAVSAGTTLVSHFRNVNALGRFLWVEDGDVRLRFEPLFPANRDGSDPDGLTDVMRQVGFDLRTDDDRSHRLHTEAAFALAEHITGVRLTAAHLGSAPFLCGPVVRPGPSGR